MSEPEPPPGATVAAVAAASALAGATMGALEPAWQVAIEPAQVLAGIVHYPAGNPFGLYELRLWTLWHQLLAPLLALGVPERALTVALSGVLGALAFAALALMALAHGAHPALAFATPFALVRLEPALWGFSYPILLVGYGHTYGMAGLAWLLLACALLGAGCRRTAAFLIGLAPAVHASLGACFALVVGACALADPRELRPHLRGVVLWGGVGAALAGLSFGVQRLAVAAPPVSDATTAARYLDTFVQLWDAHRRPANLAAWNVAMVWCGMLLAIALLGYGRRVIPAVNRLSLRIFVACGALGMAISLLLRLVPARAIPDALLVAMPTRLANLPALAFVPLLFGVLWRLRESAAARLLLLALAVMAIFWRQAPWLRAYGLVAVSVVPLLIVAARTEPRAALRLIGLGLLTYFGVYRLWLGLPILGARGASGVAALALCVLALGWIWILAEREAARRGWEARGRALCDRLAPPAARLASHLDGPLAVAFAVAVLALAVPVATGFGARMAALRDRTSDAALAAASRGEGLLVPGPGLAQMQLATRRPVLLDPEALDMLPYAADGGPELARILRDVYAVDYFDPPPQARNRAVLPEQPVRSAWEGRSAEGWTELRTRFGASDVLVPSTWRLQLPEVARSDRYALYRIEAAPSAADSK
ncbi:MAG TPA: hypothetical protein VMH82_04165 [Myxococcota bacterium]|nr:hypothetical protein [Myxococcota bacterium]